MGCETASTPSPTRAPPATDAGSLGPFTRLAPRLPLTLTPASEPSERLLALARVPALPTCSEPGVGVARRLGCSAAASPGYGEGCGTAGYMGAGQEGGGEGAAAGLAPFSADRREDSAGTQPWREEGRPPGPRAPTRAPPPQLALPESGSGPRSSRLLPAAAWRASPCEPQRGLLRGAAR